MSEQRNPVRVVVNDDPRRKKAQRNRAVLPTVADFPVGRHVVGVLQEWNGRQHYYLCEVVDVVESALLSDWKDGGVYLTGRVLDVALQSDVPLVGHLVHLGAGHERSWARHRINVSQYVTPRTFESAKEPARQRATG